jgi:hypothetical protein
MNKGTMKIQWLCLAVTWLLLTIILFQHTSVVRDCIMTISNLNLRGTEEVASPLIFDNDSKSWIRHALSLVESDDIRLRYTMIDNFPNGRAEYWNSAWAWVVAGAGRAWQLLYGGPLSDAIAHAAIWLNSFLLLVFVMLFSLWMARRIGVLTGIVVAHGMLGSNQFYKSFIPSIADHHCLLTPSVFGLILGVFLMGAGFWQNRAEEAAGDLLPTSPKMARQAAIISAACGAFGMWVSAASVFPAVFVAGLA